MSDTTTISYEPIPTQNLQAGRWGLSAVDENERMLNYSQARVYLGFDPNYIRFSPCKIGREEFWREDDLELVKEDSSYIVKKVCRHCGMAVLYKEYSDHNGYCKTCYGMLYYTCSHCGRRYEKHERRTDYKNGKHISYIRDNGKSVVMFEGRLLCKRCYDDETFICADCGKRKVKDREDRGTQAGRVCSECYTTKGYIECNMCDRVSKSKDEMFRYDGKHFCQACYVRHLGKCDLCGKIHYKRDIETIRNGEEEIYICKGCFDVSYYRCIECGRAIPKSDVKFVAGGGVPPYNCDGKWLCSDNCKVRYEYRKIVIPSKTRPPDFKFYPCGVPIDRTMGIEMEIDKKRGAEMGDRNVRRYNTSKALKGAFQELYITTDGSLSEYGLEIVSMPCSPEYLTKLNWDKLRQICVKNGYVSHNNRSCGFHIHIGRKSFGSEVEQEITISKFIIMVCINLWDEIVEFSRRSEGNLDQWAKRYDLLPTDDETAVKNKTNGRGRYYAVNVENRETIEMRVFRGTLNTTTIRATIQLCDMLIDFSKRPMEEVRKVAWGDLLKYAEQKGYTEFVDYCKIMELV